MWSKLKDGKRALYATAALALIVLCVVLLVGFLLPYGSAKNTMDPNSKVTVSTREDGALQLQWSASENADGYMVRLVDTEENLVYSTTTEECVVSLPDLPVKRELTARISSIHKNRQSKNWLGVSLLKPSPRIQKLEWEVDHNQDLLDATFDMSEGDLCRVYAREAHGEEILVGEVRNGKLKLRFGEGELLPVPEYGENLYVTFCLARTAGNVTYEGTVSETIVLTRDYFLDDEIKLEQSYNGENSYTLTWSEAKGERYDVRLSEDGGRTWMTMAYISADKERSYTTPNLKAFDEYAICVVGIGGETMGEGAIASESEILQILTREKLLYSTIWAIDKQKVYAAPDATEELGTVDAGSAWCVLGKEGQYFKIRYNGQDAYINSEYCMINLAEYLGELCLYDITNSYDSKYLVHEYEIKDVSGTVIAGYEDVRIDEDTYLVPLLFPTAQKLLQAAQEARARGYTLKIYDSYRPQLATDSIYWKTYSILNKKIPTNTFTGKVVNDLNLVGWVDVEEGFAPMELSYKRLMTNNDAYTLGSFLAPGTSRHNFGVAMDLTLVDYEGIELNMQTSMHDLSWYSAFERNNSNATTLYEIMSSAGFGYIKSEWWHYQDNEIMLKNSYKPLRTGVSWECWVADQNGWRYRLGDGSFLANCTQTIGEESFSFDENGYVIQ